MSLEEQVGRLADAIEKLPEALATALAGKLAAAGTATAADGSTQTQTSAPASAGSKKAEKPAEEKKPAEPPKPKHTIDDVRKALRDYAAIEGKDMAIEKLKEAGAESVSELDPSKYDELMAVLKGEG